MKTVSSLVNPVLAIFIASSELISFDAAPGSPG